MNVAVKSIVFTVAVGLQLAATDAAAASCFDPSGSNTDGTYLAADFEKQQPAVAHFECNDSGTSTPLPALVPQVTVTESAQERAPSIADRRFGLGLLVTFQARRFGVVVRDVVLRADWSDEDASDEFNGVVLDVFVQPGDANSRFAFWDALTEMCDSLQRDVPVSAMVHAV